MIQSPVLVGRDTYLALVEARLAGAAAAAGRLLFLAGEAGIGKTRLLGSAARRAQASSFPRHEKVRHDGQQPHPEPFVHDDEDD